VGVIVLPMSIHSDTTFGICRHGAIGPCDETHLAACVSGFRATLFKCIKPADFRAVAQKQVDEAKTGQPWAVKLVLSYLAGRSEDIELAERILALEKALESRP
jgi:hypothetical protein